MLSGLGYLLVGWVVWCTCWVFAVRLLVFGLFAGLWLSLRLYV